MEKEKDGKYLNKSLDKALSILDFFDSENSKLSVTEIAEKLDTNPSSLYPILHTLKNHGYLNRDSEKRYNLGLKFAEKGRLVKENLSLAREARPELKILRDETSRTVHLGFLSEYQIVYIDKVESKGGLRMYSSPGKTAPLHATALGKAILANMSDKNVKNILNKIELKSYTSHTHTSVKELKRELEIVREQGYALDDEEFEEGVKCMATSVNNQRGDAKAAISITGLVPKMGKEKINEFAPLMKKYASKISSKLGYEKS